MIDNKEIKQKFLDYYAVIPIQKLGAERIGVNEDTITDWKKSDKWFSDQIGFLKSEWVRSTTKRVRNAEWLLERITRDYFTPPDQNHNVKLEGLVIIKDGSKTVEVADNSMGGQPQVQGDSGGKKSG